MAVPGKEAFHVPSSRRSPVRFPAPSPGAGSGPRRGTGACRGGGSPRPTPGPLRPPRPRPRPPAAPGHPGRCAATTDPPRGKKGAPARTCTCGQPRRHKGADGRDVMSALGPITLQRVYFRCAACAMGDYALDEVLGLDGLLSKQARRLVCFFGGQAGFTRASAALHEACGWTVSDETIRQVCYQEAGRIAAWSDRDEQAYQEFPKAAGDTELQIDAAKVNTCDGWRDMKIAIYAKRQ